MALDPAGSSRIVAIATLAILAACAAALVVMAALVRYTAFIRASPLVFAAEVLVLSVGSALPIFLAAHNRGSARNRATLWHFLILSAKLAVFWVLLELAGVNTVLFTTVAPPQLHQAGGGP